MSEIIFDFLPVAYQDINAAVDYLMEEDPSVAVSFLDGMDQIKRQLTEFPNSGAPVQEKEYADKGYRFVLNCGYYVFYTFRENFVIIARILHTKRDYRKLL